MFWFFSFLVNLQTKRPQVPEQRKVKFKVIKVLSASFCFSGKKLKKFLKVNVLSFGVSHGEQSIQQLVKAHGSTKKDANVTRVVSHARYGTKCGPNRAFQM